MSLVQVARWFTNCEATTGLPICRVKNGFRPASDYKLELQAAPTYHDLKLFVLFEGTCGLRIIGEIQVTNSHHNVGMDSDPYISIIESNLLYHVKELRENIKESDVKGITSGCIHLRN